MSVLDIEGILGRLARARVCVIGDVMLDEYVHGDVERVSPEAPVPVVRADGAEYRLGGAANVARQVAALGARVSLCGTVGDDESGSRVHALCLRSRIDATGVVKIEGTHTTRKLRILGRGQQLLRIDWDGTTECRASQVSRVLSSLRDGSEPDVVILSDYAKGVVSDTLLAELMELRRRNGWRLFVDPKRPDFAAYRGADLLTPNLRELEVATGTVFDPDDERAIAATARKVVEEVRLEALVVTRGQRGILAVTRSGDSISVPAIRRDVFDVTGAGDTVIGVLATGAASASTLAESITLANAAASVAVGYVGAAAVEPAEIRTALGGAADFKVLSRDALRARVASWRAAGKRVVFTNGCFDLLHFGHISLLQEAARLGDVLVLAINSDESVKRLKGPQRPVVPQADRAAMLAALSCVSAISIFDEDTPLQVVESVRPDVLVKGQDYIAREVVGREVVEKCGGRVVLLPLVEYRSTSELIARIRSA